MFLDLFEKKKPIMAMLHLKGDTQKERMERCLREAEIYAENGVDAMILEDYYGTAVDVEEALKLLSGKGYILGVNVLDNFPVSFKLCEEYGAQFMQVDSVCGHLEPRKDPGYAEMIAQYRERSPQIQVIGGVRFKYQPVLSGRTVEEDLRLGLQRCDAMAVTGEGTGLDSPTQKIKDFRKIAGDFPIIVAAGMTADTVFEKLSLGDGAIVGSTFKDTRKDTGDVCAAHVKEFMDKVNELRATL